MLKSLYLTLANAYHVYTAHLYRAYITEIGIRRQMEAPDEIAFPDGRTPRYILRLLRSMEWNIILYRRFKEHKLCDAKFRTGR